MDTIKQYHLGCRQQRLPSSEDPISSSGFFRSDHSPTGSDNSRRSVDLRHRGRGTLSGKRWKAIARSRSGGHTTRKARRQPDQPRHGSGATLTFRLQRPWHAGHDRPCPSRRSVRPTPCLGTSCMVDLVLCPYLFLIGLRNRVRVMLEWIWYYLTFKPGAALLFPRRGAVDKPSPTDHSQT